MEIKRAAIGIQMHSGWGVLLAIASAAKKVEVLDRRRILVVDPAMPGARQPYHHARLQLDSLSLQAAEQHLANCEAICGQFATPAVQEFLFGLKVRGYRIVGAAILHGAGRALPPLDRILGFASANPYGGGRILLPRGSKSL